tara:strand:- start:59 stop:373 length:315 start_codon:yes stop_codon:yes gene_type:complete
MLEAAQITAPSDYLIDGQSFLPQLKGEVGNPRDYIYFHFEPMSGRVHRYARFIRDRRWKLYDDGRLFDLNSDPEEEAAFDPSTDNDERSEVRGRLAPVFDQMVN